MKSIRFLGKWAVSQFCNINQERIDHKNKSQLASRIMVNTCFESSWLHFVTSYFHNIRFCILKFSRRGGRNWVKVDVFSVDFMIPVPIPMISSYACYLESAVDYISFFCLTYLRFFCGIILILVLLSLSILKNILKNGIKMWNSYNSFSCITLLFSVMFHWAQPKNATYKCCRLRYKFRQKCH